MSPLVASIIVGFLAQVATAEALSPAESPAVSSRALALAHALQEQPVTQAELDAAARPIASHLLNTIEVSLGLPCEPREPACRTAAERIARDIAPQAVAARRALREQQLAIVFDGTMKVNEIDQAIAFIRTPSGRSLAAALARLSSASVQTLPADTQRRLAETTMTYRPSSIDLEAAARRFYEETRGLPRRSTLIAPPPVTSQSRRP